MKKRICNIVRDTKETKIKVKLNLDKTGKGNISTGIPFFNHMLAQIAKHADIALDIKAKGDLNIDAHHTVEDIGIAMGSAFDKGLGDKRGINRYGYSIVPLDEALVLCSLDISGRPYLSFKLKLKKKRIGNFDCDLVEEFFRAFVNKANVTLHLIQLDGKNTHHVVEAGFKAFGRALKDAIKKGRANKKTIPSTKGKL